MAAVLPLGRCLSEGPHYLRLVPATWRLFSSSASEYRATTVLCVRKNDEVVVMADGQVTMGSQVVKPNVNKIRKISDDVIGGFAGLFALSL